MPRTPAIGCSCPPTVATEVAVGIAVGCVIEGGAAGPRERARIVQIAAQALMDEIAQRTGKKVPLREVDLKALAPLSSEGVFHNHKIWHLLQNARN